MTLSGRSCTPVANHISAQERPFEATIRSYRPDEGEVLLGTNKHKFLSKQPRNILSRGEAQTGKSVLCVCFSAQPTCNGGVWKTCTSRHFRLANSAPLRIKTRSAQVALIIYSKNRKTLVALRLGTRHYIRLALYNMHRTTYRNALSSSRLRKGSGHIIHKCVARTSTSYVSSRWDKLRNCS